RTRAYHLRRAHHLRAAGDPTSAEREERTAEEAPLAGDLDSFLAGVARYRRNDLDGAARAFEEAPDHFWAQCFLAYCRLRQRRWEQARPALSVCVARRPDFVWPLLLRGFAQAQHALEQASGWPSARGTKAPAGEADFEKAQALLDQRPNDDASYALFLYR